MAEYIKREEVKEILFGAYDYAHIPKEMQGDLAEVVLNKAESIDIDDDALILSKDAYSDLCLRASRSNEAEIIVHCSECRHYKSDGGAEMVCSVTNLNVDDNDYCSYGERIDETD